VPLPVKPGSPKFEIEVNLGRGFTKAIPVGTFYPQETQTKFGKIVAKNVDELNKNENLIPIDFSDGKSIFDNLDHGTKVILRRSDDTYRNALVTGHDGGLIMTVEFDKASKKSLTKRSSGEGIFIDRRWITLSNDAFDKALLAEIPPK